MTDANGIATFEEVPSSTFTAFFERGELKAQDGGKTLYNLKSRQF